MILFILTLLGCVSDSSLAPVQDDPTEGISYKLIEGKADVWNNNLDIIFFVDTSESFRHSGSDDWQYLQDHYYMIVDPLFTPELEHVDYKIALANLDPDDDLYHTLGVNASEESVMNLLWSLDFTSPYEKGREALVESLDRDGSFHRKSASLLAIYISDEDDQSSISDLEYETAIVYGKEEPFKSVETAIVAQEEDGNCGGAAEIGETYMRYAERDLDLCYNVDWEKALNPGTKLLPVFEPTFELGEPPASEDTITVWADGHLFKDWYYTTADNTITLTSEPAEQAEITVRYLAVE